MIIGYARVSTTDQNLDRQISMLKENGFEKIIEEKFTGTLKDRQGLQTLMNVIRTNDIVVVESISRLGRKTIDILTIIQEIEDIGVQFVSLKENMDTRTSTGKAMFVCISCLSRKNQLSSCRFLPAYVFRILLVSPHTHQAKLKLYPQNEKTLCLS